MTVRATDTLDVVDPGDRRPADLTVTELLAEVSRLRAANHRWRQLVLRREQQLDDARREIALLEQDVARRRPRLFAAPQTTPTPVGGTTPHRNHGATR